MNRRWVVIATVVLLVIGVAGGVFFARLSQLEREAEAAGTAQSILQLQVNALSAQLEAEGIQPVVPPADSDAAPLVIVQEGDDGRDGRDGDDGTNAVAVDGQPGTDGVDGADGTDGTDGKDGASIPGPAGPQGADGETGPEGPAGPQGEQGVQGFPGFDAEPMLGWTFTFGIVNFECTDPDADRHYTCEPVP